MADGAPGRGNRKHYFCRFLCKIAAHRAARRNTESSLTVIFVGWKKPFRSGRDQRHEGYESILRLISLLFSDKRSPASNPES